VRRRRVPYTLVLMMGLVGLLGCTSSRDSSGEPSLFIAECRGIETNADVDLPAFVASQPIGTTFCLAAGTYRVTTPLVLKSGQKLIGAGGKKSIISGAKVVSATKQGSYWVIQGQTSLGQSILPGTTSQCRPVGGRDPKGMCVYADQVFLDDKSLWQVGSLGELSPGEFFWDYMANKIYLADDPSGRSLEFSVAPDGISGDAGVEIRNLVVEKFGNGVQAGALSASSNWLIGGVEVRLNHGGGVRMGPGTIVRDSFIHHNGELGIAGGQADCSRAKGIVLEDTELSFNNTAGYDWGWEAGATKWTNTDGLIVRNNYVHDNYGQGLWTDGFNINTVYEGNLVEDNYGAGIEHELGYAAVIRNNQIRGNAFAHPYAAEGYRSGIFIAEARDVEVYGNTVEGNAGGITALQQDRIGDLCGIGLNNEVANLFVHDNTIVQATGLAAGLKVTISDSSYYTSKNNRWEDNTYHLDDLNAARFMWQSSYIDADAWRSYGQDVSDGDFLEQ
jgi:Right handed beta helix region